MSFSDPPSLPQTLLGERFFRFYHHPPTTFCNITQLVQSLWFIPPPCFRAPNYSLGICTKYVSGWSGPLSAAENFRFISAKPSCVRDGKRIPVVKTCNLLGACGAKMRSDYVNAAIKRRRRASFDVTRTVLRHRRASILNFFS